jgi:rhodanese-related sulfurtransferase
MQIPTASVSGVPDPLPDGLVVLDVREQNEWDTGHVDGSVHLPLMQLGEGYADLPAGAQTLVVCRSGNRSAHATAFLLQQGIEAVNLDGGLLAWARAGRPLVTDDGRPPAVL